MLQISGISGAVAAPGTFLEEGVSVTFWPKCVTIGGGGAVNQVNPPDTQSAWHPVETEGALLPPRPVATEGAGGIHINSRLFSNLIGCP